MCVLPFVLYWCSAYGIHWQRAGPLGTLSPRQIAPTSIPVIRLFVSAGEAFNEREVHPNFSFRTAVPLWGQITYNLSGLSPKRDCGSKGVKKVHTPPRKLTSAKLKMNPDGKTHGPSVQKTSFFETSFAFRRY